jgi:hypothetical protein
MSQRNKSSGKYKIDKKEQVKMFDYVNSHLTLMENNYDNHKSLFVVKENNQKVVIPEPRYQSSINKSPMDRQSKSTSKPTSEPYVYSSYHDFDCTICMEDIKVGEYVQKLKCKHLFHADCLLWYHSDPDSTLICPTCEDDLME